MNSNLKYFKFPITSVVTEVAISLCHLQLFKLLTTLLWKEILVEILFNIILRHLFLYDELNYDTR
jgi:uncharacterized membrane protein